MTDPTQQPDPAQPGLAQPAPASAPAPAQPHPASAPPAPAKPQVLSLISMISGILGVVIGFVGVGLLFSIGAVVLGHLGQRKENHARGLWITGLVTGYIGILVNLVVIVFWIIFFVALASAGNWNWYDYQDFNEFR